MQQKICLVYSILELFHKTEKIIKIIYAWFFSEKYPSDINNEEDTAAMFHPLSITCIIPTPNQSPKTPPKFENNSVQDKAG